PMSTTDRQTAFIGLGDMGAPLARQIAARGLALAVGDVSTAAREKFRGLARLAESPADAARGVRTAHVCVRDDAQVEEVVFGAKGLVEGLDRGALVVVHSTIRVETVKALRARLVERGIDLIDAPITNTPRTPDGRFVLTMVGGTAEEIALARPVLETFSTDIVEVGPCGSAMALKIGNNLVSWVHIVLALQAERLTSDHGVPEAVLRRVMQANGNLTPLMAQILDFARAAREGPDAATRALRASQAGIGEKDLSLAIECGEAAGLDMQMARSAKALVRPLYGGQ
ncbi:NAD(P)-dependent oxidoreductase, partial [Myxococcota bacterium]|nr:NAD(P)-dependent oxidoreductase [Myxococcota bacterium]